MVRKRSDDLRDYIIEPILKALEIKPERSDTLADPGNITSKVIMKINEADIIIADLTDRNPNVFYELAIAHALRKPVIHMIKKGEKVPFDVNQYRYVTYDETDLAELQPTKNELKSQLENIPQKPEDVINPFTEAFGLMRIDKSGNPTEKIIAELKTMYGSFESRLRHLEDIVVEDRETYYRGQTLEQRNDLLRELQRAEAQSKEVSRELSSLQRKNNKTRKELEREESLNALYDQSISYLNSIRNKITRTSNQTQI